MKRSAITRFAFIAVCALTLRGASVLTSLNCGKGQSTCFLQRSGGRGDIECICQAKCAVRCPELAVNADREALWNCNQAVTGQVKGGSTATNSGTVTAVFAQAAVWGGILGGTFNSPPVFSKKINDCYNGIIRDDPLINIEGAC